MAGYYSSNFNVHSYELLPRGLPPKHRYGYARGQLVLCVELSNTKHPPDLSQRCGCCSLLDGPIQSLLLNIKPEVACYANT